MPLWCSEFHTTLKAFSKANPSICVSQYFNVHSGKLYQKYAADIAGTARFLKCWGN